VSRYETIAPHNQLASGAYDRRAVSDEATLTNSNCPTSRKSLIADRDCDIFISMVLVYNQNILCDENARLKMNAVLSVYLRSPVNDAVILNHNYGIALLFRRNTHTQTGIFFYDYVISQLNPMGNSSINRTRRMD
jgi:hypothetical protein